MDIYDTWKIYKEKIDKEIIGFNEAIKVDDFQTLAKHKDNAKNYYSKFIELLKCESSSDQRAFKETLDDYIKDIKKMGEYVKNNAGKKKVLANN